MKQEDRELIDRWRRAMARLDKREVVRRMAPLQQRGVEKLLDPNQARTRIEDATRDAMRRSLDGTVPPEAPAPVLGAPLAASQGWAYILQARDLLNAALGPLAPPPIADPSREALLDRAAAAALPGTLLDAHAKPRK